MTLKTVESCSGQRGSGQERERCQRGWGWARGKKIMNKRKAKHEGIYRINWTFIVVKTGTKHLNYVNQGHKLKEKLIFQSNKKSVYCFQHSTGHLQCIVDRKWWGSKWSLWFASQYKFASWLYAPDRGSQWLLQHQVLRQEACLMCKRIFIFA